MNVEICKKCHNHPKFYLLGSSKDKIGFFGYQDTERGGTRRLSCVVSYDGTKYNKNIVYNIPTAKIENLLKDSMVVPVETICPYYTEHLMSEWNKK